jgi:hypothetical protein
MASRFDNYETTETGARLTQIIALPEMIPEYCALSRIGKPAVQAIGADVAPLIENLPTKEERDAASQFVGWRVAKVMRGLGYTLIQERGRVTGAPYRTGAVWSYEPGRVKVAVSIPQGISRKVDVRVKTEGGQIVADIDATDEGEGSVHRLHSILRMRVPFEEAIDFATSYAERHGFGYVHVLDADRHLPLDRLRSFL